MKSNEMSDPVIDVPNFIDEDLLAQRKIFLFGEITESAATRIIKELFYLAKQADPISIYICSDGGDLESAMAIIDTINLIKSKNIVKTIGFKAISAAAYILSIGTKGFRYATSASTIMLHKVSVELPMDSEDSHKIFIEFGKKQSGEIYAAIAKACGKATDKFVKDIGTDLWLNANQAKKYKIVDKIVKDLADL